MEAHQPQTAICQDLPIRLKSYTNHGFTILLPPSSYRNQLGRVEETKRTETYMLILGCFDYTLVYKKLGFCWINSNLWPDYDYSQHHNYISNALVIRVPFLDLNMITANILRKRNDELLQDKKSIPPNAIIHVPIHHYLFAWSLQSKSDIANLVFVKEQESKEQTESLFIKSS